METALESTLRSQLADRRTRLLGAVAELPQAVDLLRLLREVDSALERMEAGSYGLCEVCHTDVDEADLRARPLLPYCLCQLSPAQQTALEHDLELAARVQWSLLPQPDLGAGGWETHFRYEPHGVVSGDYCDLLVHPARNEMHALVGDVSGKGVAASMLMARLSALVRGLVEEELPLGRLLERSSRLFAQGKPASHYATLVAARMQPSGRVEVCNAGHCRPLLVRAGKVSAIHASGFPIGLVLDGGEGGREYQTEVVDLEPGDSLVLYTDGLTEAFDRQDQMYGGDRLIRALERSASLSPRRLAAGLLADQAAFLAGQQRQDDLALLVLRRSAVA